MEDKVKVIGINAVNIEDAFKIGDVLEKVTIVTRYEDLMKEFAARILGFNLHQMQDTELLKSYLGNEWSYVRNERFVEDGEVNIKPIRYHLSPESIIKRIQFLGREIHSNFWVNGMFARFSQWDTTRIITDVIYPNEADGILDHNGMLVRIDRTTGRSKANDFLAKHPGFTKRYTTDGSPESLREIINDLTKYVLQ